MAHQPALDCYKLIRTATGSTFVAVPHARNQEAEEKEEDLGEMVRELRAACRRFNLSWYAVATVPLAPTGPSR